MSASRCPPEAASAPSDSSSWRLTWLILVGLVLGAGVGQALFLAFAEQVPESVLAGLHFIGDTVFMSLLMMVLVPLVASSVVVGVSSIGDPGQLGRLGTLTAFYYFATMLLAGLLGVLLVTSIRPGELDADTTARLQVRGQAAYAAQGSSQREGLEESGEAGIWGATRSITAQLIPRNPIAAAAAGQLLPVIAFSLICGIGLCVIGRRGRPLLDVFRAAFTLTMQLVEWILYLAPMGVFALVAWTVGRAGLSALVGPLSKYVATVLVGLVIHGLLVLPAILAFFGRTHPYRYLHQMRAALVTAFGTDSSSVTLPVTLQAAVGRGGVKESTARFVLPLGATINMDGTALYEAVAVVFLFQCYGIPLGGTELAIVVITATLAAVGAAGIPSAGLVTMAVVVTAVNGSLGGDKALPIAAIGILLGIDRLLDMCRTTINVWGDAVGAKLIDGLEVPAN